MSIRLIYDYCVSWDGILLDARMMSSQSPLCREMGVLCMGLSCPFCSIIMSKKFHILHPERARSCLLNTETQLLCSQCVNALLRALMFNSESSRPLLISSSLFIHSHPVLPKVAHAVLQTLNQHYGNIPSPQWWVSCSGMTLVFPSQAVVNRTGND